MGGLDVGSLVGRIVGFAGFGSAGIGLRSRLLGLRGRAFCLCGVCRGCRRLGLRRFRGVPFCDGLGCG